VIEILGTLRLAMNDCAGNNTGAMDVQWAQWRTRDHTETARPRRPGEIHGTSRGSCVMNPMILVGAQNWDVARWRLRPGQVSNVRRVGLQSCVRLDLQQAKHMALFDVQVLNNTR